jgi:hypothetical protein
LGDSRSTFVLGRLGLGDVLVEEFDAFEIVDDFRSVVGLGGRRVLEVNSEVDPGIIY